MQEILQNTQENDIFFYIFIGILVILSGFVNLFKNNLSQLYNKRVRINVRNESLFMVSGAILVSLSAGIFLSVIAQWFYVSVGFKINYLPYKILFYSFLCYIFAFCYILCSRIIFFVLRIKSQFMIYHLVYLRFILPIGAILLTAAPVIRYSNFSPHARDIALLSIMIMVGLITIIGIIKRMIHLIKQTNIPLYYIILYL